MTGTETRATIRPGRALRGAIRVAGWGAAAMALTSVIGRLFGAVV